uniref:Interleukin-12 subunit alpha n=1 Tax=Seriola dumerili TaxID=41447 RepID=A0A1E1G7P9_SERDU|nr:interleukin-12p35b [Seriola dumerili]
MPLIKLYFTPALLLLMLSCPLWQLSQSLPMMRNGPVTDSCVLYGRTLLQNITVALSEKEMFHAINCTEQSVELNMETNTPSVCAPKESTCSGIAKSEFDQESCLTEIEKDLRHYYKFLTAQPDPSKLLDKIVLSSLREFMENCFTWSLSADLTSKQAAVERDSTFEERLNLCKVLKGFQINTSDCKVLKGFQIRTITINRVIGYMNSGEHAK